MGDERLRPQSLSRRLLTVRRTAAKTGRRLLYGFRRKAARVYAAALLCAGPAGFLNGSVERAAVRAARPEAAPPRRMKPWGQAEAAIGTFHAVFSERNFL